jgi:glutaredoxin-like protein
MLLTRSTRKEVEAKFAVLKKPVTLSVFTQGMECQTCRETRLVCEELAEISSKIAVEVNDFREDKNLVDKYGVERIPAVIIVGKEDFRIHFYGTPTGYVFDALLDAIKMVSLDKIALQDATKAYLESLVDEVNLKVLVSPTCLNCPPAIELAYRLSYYSPLVTAEMINLTDFPWLAIRYATKTVPVTIVNDSISLEGAFNEPDFIQKLKVVGK